MWQWEAIQEMLPPFGLLLMVPTAMNTFREKD
jgi:hypothetical protein